MMRVLAIVLFAACVSDGMSGEPAVPPPATTQPAAAKTDKTLDLAKFFEDFDGCFVLLDVQRGEYSRYNAARCAERFSPCSTFKIPNSLIGLETGVLSGAEHEYKWDGRKNLRKECDRDHTLRTAIRDSVLWYFQRVAAGVGEARMKAWLAKFDYGNRDMSGGLTQFWIDGSLLVSANEQVEFIRKLQAESLPMSAKTQILVKELLIVDSTPEYTLRGKTGTQGDKDRDHAILGWFVGAVESKGSTYIFACNLSANTGARGSKARDVCRQVLGELGILPASKRDANGV